MLLADFIQFVANYIILIALLRIAQAKMKDTEWGKALAFLG